LDEARLAAMASKLWHSAASAKAKTVERIEETFGDESGSPSLLLAAASDNAEEDFADPDSYDDYLEFHRRQLLMDNLEEEEDDYADPDSYDDYWEFHRRQLLMENEDDDDMDSHDDCLERETWMEQHPVSCLHAAAAE
jgi:hypothetical protein